MFYLSRHCQSPADITGKLVIAKLTYMDRNFLKNGDKKV